MATKKKTTKRKPAAKKATGRKRGGSAGPVDNLNDRQRAVRRAIIEGRGRISPSALAKEWNVSRITIWRDRKIVEQLIPKKRDDFDEDKAIDDAIEFYESAIDFAMDELDRVEQAENLLRDNGDAGTISSSMKVGLLNSISRLRRDQSEFLMEIGYIKRAPTQFGMDPDALAAMKTPTEVRAKLTAIKSELKELRAARKAATDDR